MNEEVLTFALVTRDARTDITGYGVIRDDYLPLFHRIFDPANGEALEICGKQVYEDLLEVRELAGVADIPGSGDPPPPPDVAPYKGRFV